MKDYISYEIFRQIGIEAPLCSYAQIYINGLLNGLYLAMEEIDGAFVDRAFEGNGEIYKPSNDPENGAMEPGDDKGFSNGDSPARTAETADDEASDDAASANGTADATVAAVTSEQAASDRIDSSAIDISLTQGNKSPRGEGDSEGDSASDASKGKRQQEAAEAETEAEN